MHGSFSIFFLFLARSILQPKVFIGRFPIIGVNVCNASSQRKPEEQYKRPIPSCVQFPRRIPPYQVLLSWWSDHEYHPHSKRLSSSIIYLFLHYFLITQCEKDGTKQRIGSQKERPRSEFFIFSFYMRARDVFQIFDYSDAKYCFCSLNFNFYRLSCFLFFFCFFLYSGLNFQTRSCIFCLSC